MARLSCCRFRGHRVKVFYGIMVSHLTNWFEHAGQCQLLAYADIQRIRPFIELLTPSRTIDAFKIVNGSMKGGDWSRRRNDGGLL